MTGLNPNKKHTGPLTATQLAISIKTSAIAIQHKYIMQHATHSECSTSDVLEDMLSARHAAAVRQRAEVAQSWAKIKWRESPAFSPDNGPVVASSQAKPATVVVPIEEDVHDFARRRMLSTHGPNAQCVRVARGSSFAKQLPRGIPAEAWSGPALATQRPGKDEMMSTPPCVVDLPTLGPEQFNTQAHGTRALAECC